MLAALNAPGRRGLVANLVAWLGACLAENGLIFGRGWAADAGAAPNFAPPGWVIGTVWVGLFVAMSAARWRLRARPGPRRWVTALLVSCLAYPWYALATGSLPAGFAGNVLTLVLAVAAVAAAWPYSRLAAGLVAPVAVWLAFAGGLTAAELGLVG